jgi:hypothetical protein
MKLKFIYVPQWALDPFDGWFQRSMQSRLHYSMDNGETWQMVESEPYPDAAEVQKRQAATDPRKK